LTRLSGGYYRKGATVLQQCFPEDFEVLVKNPTSNAWAGSIRRSTDGGLTYASGFCTTCNPTGVTAQIVVDGNADSGDQASVRCFNGKQCIVTQAPQYCVDIVTGTNGNNDGTLDVVIQSRRSRVSLREVYADYYRKGETVLQECFSEDFEVLVQNPTSNAWTGSVRLSTNGGSNYFPGLCTPCTGTIGPAFQFVVDGNADSGDQAPVACFHGRQCVVVPSVLFASALAQAAPRGPLAACEMLSTNASAPSQCPDTPLFNQAYECIYNTKCLTGSEAGCVERTGCQYVY
jgi:ketosteroid isomerase-like protein